MNESLIYPGAYHTMPYHETGSNQPSTGKACMVPAVQMTDLGCVLKVEVYASGFSREDFVVTCKPSGLDIYASCPTANSGSVLLTAFQRHIPLPDCIDVEFISARYNNGVLSFHLPKATKEKNETRANDEVVIY